ncbi:MAG: DUF1552 domain-containing protein [Archangiaceae bacterium]|nr:DUF1552 domain-containing protein [Archangiaceae bacterium]
MSTRPLSRRTLLRGAGGIGIALPFLTAMEARAQAAPPRRFISFYTAHGFHRDTMNLTGTETQFKLSPALTSLTPWQSKLLVLDNVDLEVGYHAAVRAPHFAIAMLLSGLEIQSGTLFTAGTDQGPVSAGWGGGITIDQKMAQTIGRSYPLASLELGVQVGPANVWSRLSYTGPAQPVAPEERPLSAFTRVFGNFTPPGTTPPPLDAKTLQRRSIIDRVKGDFATLNARLGPEDRRRVDAHLTAIREIERRLSVVAPPPASSACSKPAAPPSFNVNDVSRFEEVGRLQMDIMAMAITCNLTAVGQLMWSWCQNQLVFSQLGLTQGHHLLSHSALSNTQGQADLAKIDRFYADQLAYLLGKLSLPEGNGTVLDSCTVLWLSELAKGNAHDNRDMSFLLAGSCGGYFKTGRLVRFPTAAWSNDLLVSLLNAMRVTDAAGGPVQTFGNPAWCKQRGGLNELRA